jgi:hypothetical protein
MLCKTLAYQVCSEGPERPTEIKARHKKSSLLRGKFDSAEQLQPTEGPHHSSRTRLRDARVHTRIEKEETELTRRPLFTKGKYANSTVE